MSETKPAMPTKVQLYKEAAVQHATKLLLDDPTLAAECHRYASAKVPGLTDETRSESTPYWDAYAQRSTEIIILALARLVPVHETEA